MPVRSPRHPVPRYFPFSAGVVVVRRVEGAWRVLLLRSYRNWDFPKGGVERGETALQAAIRETREEADITDLVFNWGEIYRETGPYGRQNKTARYYIAETCNARIHLPISEKLGRPEHHEGRWVDLTEAVEMLPPRLQAVLAWATQVLTAAAPAA